VSLADDDEADGYDALIAVLMCERCRLEVPYGEIEVVTFTDVTELWCSDCRG